MTGVAVSVLLGKAPRRLRLYAAVALIIAGFSIYELKSEAPQAISGTFNWIPFKYQLAYELGGFGTILEGIWPFAALAYLSMLLHGKLRKATIAVGGAAVFAFVFTLEWQQVSIPGRTADITPAILAIIGWSGPFLLIQDTKTQTA